MRIALGFLVVAAALAGAFAIHDVWKAHQTYPASRTWCGPERRFTPCRRPHWVVSPATYRKASWQDPLAIFVAIGGVGVGLAVVVPALRS